MPLDPGQFAPQNPLSGLWKVRWWRYRHAYGRAWDIPKLLRGLASDSAAKRDKALSQLYRNIWHQGTVYEAATPTIPFLIRLAAHPTQANRPAIIQYLAELATGHSWHDVHSRNDAFGLKSRPDFEKTLAQELSWVRSAHEAIAKEWALYLRWMDDDDAAVRAAIPYLMAVLPEYATETVPRIRQRLAFDTDGDARASLLRALAVLAGGDADPELRLALADTDPLVRVAASMGLACHRAADRAVRDVLWQAWTRPESITERWNRLPWCSEGAQGDVGRCLALLEADTEPILTEVAAAVEADMDYPALATAGMMLQLAFQGRRAPAVSFTELSETQQRVVRILAERICQRYDTERCVFFNMTNELEAFGLPGDPEKLREYVGLAKPEVAERGRL